MKIIPTIQPKSRQGQAGLILILFIALGLVLYAITLNWSRAAQIKALTIKAANTGVAAMASYVASYGEKYLKEQLGGERKICKSTSLLAALLSFLVIIIVIIIMAICQQYYAIPITAAMWTTVIVGAVLAFASVVMQAAIIQPGITRMWNNMMAESMSIEDQAMEKGLQLALQIAVTDNVKIPDLYDMDMDGFYGDLQNPADSSSGHDYINRFAYFYTRRLQHIPKINYDAIENFQRALKELIEKDPYGTGDTQGLFDPGRQTGPCSGANDKPPAECDPCCQPQYLRDGNGTILLVQADENDPSVVEPVPVRPICCDDSTTSCAFHTGYETFADTGDLAFSCEARSPYQGGGNDYGLIYDPVYENSSNNDRTHPDFQAPYYLSIREKFGKDDEHSSYNVDASLPRWHTFYHNHFPLPADYSVMSLQTPEIIPPVFRFEDVTGVYNSLDYPALSEPDDQKGIFPFFHKVKDFGVGLSSLTYNNRQCHWCDPNAPGAAICGADTKDSQLDLFNDPAVYNGGWCLDNSNAPGAGDFPQIADMVPNLGENVIARDDVCASDVGGWKKGYDRFCSPIAPYDSYCPKNQNFPEEIDGAGAAVCRDFAGEDIPVDCLCEDDEVIDKTLFNGDWLDEFIYGLGEFIQWAQITINARPADIYNYFISWFDGEAFPWIDHTNFDALGNVDDKLGYLTKWLHELSSFSEGINSWGNSSYEVLQCSDAWCVPQAGCACAKAGERSAATGIQQVIDCLDFNANDTVNYPVAASVAAAVPGVWSTPATGNAEKFQACATNCALASGTTVPIGFEACHDLPRSLLSSGASNFCSSYGTFVNNAAEVAPYENVYACLATNYPTDIPPTLDATPAFELPAAGYPASPAGQVMACNDKCSSGLPVTIGAVTRTQTFTAPAITYQCVNANSCQEGSAFMNAVSALAGLDCSLYPHSEPECTNHKNAFANCFAQRVPAATCTATTGNYAAMQALSCRAECGNLPTQLLHDGTAADPDGILPYNLLAFGDVQVRATGPTNACGNDAFFSELSTMLKQSEEKCNGTPAGYIAAVQTSADEAVNQVTKFRKRQQFLQNRKDEGENVVSVIEEARALIWNFLISPAVNDLIALRSTIGSGTLPNQLPSFAIYGWQDPKREKGRIRVDDPGGNNPTYDGYWHIVKVEGRIPKRCNNACGTNRWPWVRTWTERWGTRRCYEITDTEGMTKLRVIRWDEDRSASWRSGVMFPNRMPIWNFRFGYPGLGVGDILNIKASCMDYGDQLLNVAPYRDYNWDKAFMINQRPDFGSGDVTCWNVVHDHLRRGVMSTSCAKYKLVGSDFRVLFTPCDDMFVDGLN